MTTYNGQTISQISGSGSSNTDNTLNNSTVTGNFTGGGGSDTLTLNTDSAINGRASGGEGNDNFTLNSNSSIDGQNSDGDSIATGGGNDTVNINGTANVEHSISMVSGNDTFNMTGGTVGGDVDIGSGDDEFTMTSGSIGGEIRGSWGEDIISISDANIDGNVYGGRGYAESNDEADSISISGSTIGGDINGDNGDDSISISGTSVSGTIMGGSGSDTFTISSLTSNLVIDGNEDSGDGDTDTLDLSGLTGTIEYDASSNSENGVFTEDGTGNTITFSNIEYRSDPVAPICFTTGMAIMTVDGEKKVEDLKIGDLVPTLDNGPQAVRYIYARTLPLNYLSMPICFEPNTIGNDRTLIVSQKHCFHTGSLPKECIPEHAAENDDHLIHADMFVNGTTIRYDLSQKTITYFHIMFAKHELIECHGTWSESWHPIRRAVKKDAAMRKEILQFYPEIMQNNQTNMPTVRQFGTTFMMQPDASLLTRLQISERFRHQN